MKFKFNNIIKIYIKKYPTYVSTYYVIQLIVNIKNLWKNTNKLGNTYGTCMDENKARIKGDLFIYIFFVCIFLTLYLMYILFLYKITVIFYFAGFPLTGVLKIVFSAPSWCKYALTSISKGMHNIFYRSICGNASSST